MKMKIEVIGAGVAGSFAALELAKQGYEVTAYDLKKEVMPARCGELIREKYLKEVGLKARENEISYTTNKVSVELINNNSMKKFEMKSKERYYVLNRQEFEKRIISQAREEGAEIKFNNAKREFSKTSDDLGNTVPR
jgi:flavin-dependent dehydrogenase